MLTWLLAGPQSRSKATADTGGGGRGAACPLGDLGGPAGRARRPGVLSRGRGAGRAALARGAGPCPASLCAGTSDGDLTRSGALPLAPPVLAAFGAFSKKGLSRHGGTPEPGDQGGATSDQGQAEAPQPWSPPARRCWGGGGGTRSPQETISGSRVFPEFHFLTMYL